MVSLSCTDFVEALASKAPVPGGGGAAAFAGALGIALCSMVGNLTVGNKKYAAVESDMRVMLEKAKAVQTDLLMLIDEDAKAFEPLSKVYAIPKDDPRRGEIMESALQNACKPPMEMMRCCCRAIVLLEEMMDKGSAMLVSDVGVGLELCRAALIGASMNVFINTKPMKNEENKKRLNKEANDMLAEYVNRAETAGSNVLNRLREKEST